MPRALDGDDLPFSAYDLARALRLLMPRRRAEREAARMAAVVRAAVAGRARAAAAARAGVRDVARINPPQWVIPDDVFLLLSLVSPAYEARVDAWRRARVASPGAAAERWLRDAWGVAPPARPPRPAAEREAAWAAHDASWRAARAGMQAAVRARRAGHLT